jgi:4-amino-4-deoxy-L-arabinose transferase-like glycosyltransferase
LNSDRRTDWLVLLGFCLFFFFYGLSSFGLVGADEPRYAQVAREMYERRDWITPTLGGKAWLEKPALYYWQAEIAYAIFGVHDWVARIPSAVDATLLVVAAHFFLLRLRRAVALDGALMVASSAAIVGFAHAAATDMPLAATFSIALLAWYSWWETRANWLLAVFYGFLGLATLAKGPVGPVLAAAVIVLFAIAAGRLETLPKTLWFPGIIVFLAVALPWYAAVQIKNPEFFRVFILQHNLARFGTNLYRHDQPFWFFLPVLALSLLPWLVFVVAGAWEMLQAWWSERRAIFNSRDALSVFLLIWLVVPVVFFSASQSKLPGYILPAIPAGPLLVAEYIRRRLSSDGKEPEKPSAAAASLHGVFAVLPFVPAVFLPYLILGRAVPLGPALIVAGLLAFVLALAIGLTLRTMGIRVLRTVTLVPVVLCVASLIRLGSSTVNARLSARPVAEELKHLASESLPVATYDLKRETGYGLAFYCNCIVASYEDGLQPEGEHLLVTPVGPNSKIAFPVRDRHVELLGEFPPQGLEFYRVEKKR